MEIAIPLYDRFTALDAVGPYEVLWRLPGARVRWVGTEARPYSTDRGLQLIAEATLDEVPAPDVLVVPGGTGTRDALGDERLVEWIRAADATSTWKTSVCTGALPLGAAGLRLRRRAAARRGGHPRRPARDDALGLHGRPRRLRRRGDLGPCRAPGEGDHVGRRVVRHRHGADARRRDRRGGRRAGDPAAHRVRPDAAVRHRLDREGARAHPRARADAAAGVGVGVALAARRPLAGVLERPVLLGLDEPG